MNNPATTSSITKLSYCAYIWRIKTNRDLLLFSLGISVGLFLVFKVFYPYPDFFGDSYSYIYAADARLDINIWPIGYSKFLAWFHELTYSSTALIAFQYFAMQLAALHFTFTVLYFFNLSLWHRNALVLFLVINPLTLYLCNTVNSDALFALLTLLWITDLVWIIQRPRLSQVLSSAALVFLCFTVRNNAYYYPLVGAAAFLVSREGIFRKVSGIVLPLLFITFFVIHTRDAAYRLTGTRQFSLFTGWQLANNALYMYDQIEVDSSDFPTAEARELNRYSLRFMRRVNPDHYREFLDSYVGNFFIREPTAPLKQYYGSHYRFDGKNANIINWAKASEIFEPFGKSLILQHPLAYVEYFVLPNIRHYLIPPLSHIGLYNYGQNQIDPIAKNWFHYRTNTIHVASHNFQGQLLLVYVGLFLLLNVYYLWNVLLYAFRSGFKGWQTGETGTQVTMLAYLVLNFLFSIATTVNILRYQYVPMLVLAAFGLALRHELENKVSEVTGRPGPSYKCFGFGEPKMY
jgi:hypothetical protein